MIQIKFEKVNKYVVEIESVICSLRDCMHIYWKIYINIYTEKFILEVIAYYWINP